MGIFQKTSIILIAMNDKYEGYVDTLSLGNKIARAGWNVIALLFFRPFIGPLFRNWRSMVLRLCGAKIGKRCAIAAGAKIWSPWNLVVSDYVAIANGAEIYNVAKITIGHHVTISQDSYICAASHDISKKLKPLITAPILIGDLAWVCARAIILPGVTIGEGAVVGAGSVVTKDVEPLTVVGGNPAKFIKKREFTV